MVKPPIHCRYHICVLQHTRKPTTVPDPFSPGLYYGLIEILYQALLCTHCFYQWTFIFSPPPHHLHPPSSHLDPAVRYHSLPLSPASCQGGQLLASPRHHHPCHLMNHFTIGDELHGQQYGTQATVCFAVYSCPCVQAGVNIQMS